MNVTFRQLKVFVKLFELRSFTATAQALNMTQSAVSKLCQELESEVGFPLFQRSTRRVEPMDGAADFHAFATEMLGTLAAASRSLADLRSLQKGTISVAAAPLIFYGLLCDVIAEFHSLHPDVRIEGFEISTDLAIEYVINGKVDVGVVALDEVEPKLIAEPIYTDHIYLACPAHHRLAEKRQVSWKDLRDEAIVMLRDDHNLGKIMQSSLARSNVTMSSVIEVGAMSSVVGLVKAGAGIAFAPEYTYDFCARAGIRLIPFVRREQTTRTLSLIRRENASLSLAATSFVKLLEGRLGERGAARR
ncbi:LysR family transcriptional regulator [Paraburkholderia antibiotica]|uniref:LysR family transcriptional regulator n=1 Tax=Paraburkholderia antibiotica TaxID=2728839 RepID=A0A7X9X5C6_9BURK|nr:LysR family transcriptional regulator [Paraburkholderia antibiotica]NML31753.1 LysR family transcriptional regulator [Paraburkholderia antibiotica]